ncbi:hypothetical protein OGAPHI_006699 [Ogataea philodendri]|uniref:Uncharacterized protein n=1 Tax=Ogataea philodendri TaxID=1378263 RepID=A0A9P8NXB5_9ASCO|nr:uncharacterized protein OGAPHI_006699 [Ogataea philodendri]KAH3661292.1 hypothetical protein OGAPHI_006699 [Ogataea philodendri]
MAALDDCTNPLGRFKNRLLVFAWSPMLNPSARWWNCVSLSRLALVSARASNDSSATSIKSSVSYASCNSVSSWMLKLTSWFCNSFKLASISSSGESCLSARSLAIMETSLVLVTMLLNIVESCSCSVLSSSSSFREDLIMSKTSLIPATDFAIMPFTRPSAMPSRIANTFPGSLWARCSINKSSIICIDFGPSPATWNSKHRLYPNQSMSEATARMKFIIKRISLFSQKDLP